MKYGPFAMWPAFPTSDYYGPLRLPLGRPLLFPGSPVIGGHRFPSPRRQRGQDGSPEFPGRPSARSTPNYAGGSLSARFWIPGAFHGLRRECTGSAPSIPRPQASTFDDACSGFTRVADRTVASVLLRTRPLDHARGHRYQGPRRLPRPDSHRQAIPNLSLLRHRGSFPAAPEQSRRTHP